jgi:hypothetical protein
VRISYAHWAQILSDIFPLLLPPLAAPWHPLVWSSTQVQLSGRHSAPLRELSGLLRARYTLHVFSGLKLWQPTVSIATDEEPQFDSREVQEIFVSSTASRSPLDPNSLLSSVYRRVFQRAKAAEAWNWTHTSILYWLWEIVKLCVYFPVRLHVVVLN